MMNRTILIGYCLIGLSLAMIVVFGVVHGS